MRHPPSASALRPSRGIEGRVRWVPTAGMGREPAAHQHGLEGVLLRVAAGIVLPRGSAPLTPVDCGVTIGASGRRPRDRRSAEPDIITRAISAHFTRYLCL